MGMRIRVGLLLLLCATAALTGAEALSTIRKSESGVLPEEVYAQFSARADSAEFYLKSEDGYVAVFGGVRDKRPVTVTTIEVAGLRCADAAMLEKGIPVTNTEQLLALLEDLGS